MSPGAPDSACRANLGTRALSIVAGVPEQPMGVADLIQILADPRATEDLATRRPLVVVDLDSEEPHPTSGHVPAIASQRMSEQALGSAPLIVVGLAVDADRRSAFVDTVVDPGGTDLAAIGEMVVASPLASLAFVLLLRGADQRSAEQGLIAESTTYSMLQAGPEFRSWRSSTEARPPADVGPRVCTTRIGDVLDVVLTRPGRHNAIDVAMRDELSEALELAVVDRSIARIDLRAEGPSFSSGGDLDSFGGFVDVADAHRVRLTRSPARLAARLAPRLVAHLHGSCIGGGIEIAAFADRVIGRADVRIRLPEVGYGLIPGAGGTVSLPRRIGRHRTVLIGLTGRSIGLDEAVRWGLVDEIER